MQNIEEDAGSTDLQLKSSIKNRKQFSAGAMRGASRKKSETAYSRRISEG
jgi:hypothetical protein